ILMNCHLINVMSWNSLYYFSMRIIQIPIILSLCKEKNCLIKERRGENRFLRFFLIYNDFIRGLRIVLLIFKISTNQHFSSNWHRSFIDIKFRMMVWIRMFRYVCAGEKEGTRLIL